MDRSRSMSVPSILVYPPLEEAFSEACVSYSPEEAICGLLNPSQSMTLSAINALLQLFMNLPELNQELPAHSLDVAVARFVALAKSLHLCSDDDPDVRQSPQPTAVLAALPWIDASISQANSTDPPQDFEAIVRGFLDCVLLKTRFGRRFDHQIAKHHNPDAIHSIINTTTTTTTTIAAFDSIAATSTSGTKEFTPSFRDANEMTTATTIDNNSNNTTSSAGTLPPTPISPVASNKMLSILRLDISEYSQNATVSLLSLLNSHFGRCPPSLFFGGNPAKHTGANKKISEFSMTATKQQFHLLPHFLVVSFNRRMLPFKDDINTTTTTTTAANAIPISTRSSHAQSTPAKDLPRYHATTIELPLELDLGFYLDPAATMPAHAGFRKDSRIPTFYRLHGFVTQSQAHFMTYTRLRGGLPWFKCDDSVISSVDLGSRIASKGVMVALYRMQD
ncbi:hypothetical protein BASA50_009390 [Batrachochytrium salamandrivorans]|uniref:Peptidase C19 ubiquitin carboxyl-terminal hydrolase domain-containing protein n=1 Tax=Batrachochytrium salamandrivorans TaxID=1357716 RepID=A0ABQ8F205_9FUNG|nr:hypothetical protein BASA50_009390 [Batrachochytrium salamandrivorans]